jgi:endogenous inhibitor of DNA gyrase (YacG/DUF329 family)
MTMINCDFCSKKFYKKPSQIKLCLRNFCSNECSHKARRSGKIKKCHICKKEAYKELRYLKQSRFFCSKKCQMIWLSSHYKGKNHPNWTTGESSYKEAMVQGSKIKQCIICSKDDQRILSVHHLDQNRKNNILENLVWVCRNCHHLIHCYESEKLKLVKLLKHNG